MSHSHSHDDAHTHEHSDSGCCHHAKGIDVAFPRNRLFPPVIDSDTWTLSENVKARVVRIAPKCKYPVAHGACVKLLRGETNEVPTPLAACKAVRSVLCPDYLQEVVAGAEGALVLLTWREHSTEDQIIPFSPSATTASGEIDDSAPIRVHEGDVYCCAIQFQRAKPGSVSTLKTYADQVFGEIGVVFDGSLLLEWFPSSDSSEASQVLHVESNFEYGPFYQVDGYGHLVHARSGGLVYVPHRYVFDPSSEVTAVWATVRFPLNTSEVAGPHRHCYT